MLATHIQKIGVILAQSYGFERIWTNGSAIGLQDSKKFYRGNDFVPKYQGQNQLFAAGKVFRAVRIGIPIFFRAEF